MTDRHLSYMGRIVYVGVDVHKEASIMASATPAANIPGGRAL